MDEIVLVGLEKICYYKWSGVWRSLVARLHGVQEVAGSNPVTPTKL